MIRVNFRKMEWQEGLTVEGLLLIMREDKAYEHILREKATVIVNNELVSPAEYSKRMIRDGDEIRVYPVIAGG